jgi:3-hydroxyacyl-[acyl-carrier-protein] dehydratase
MHLEFFQMLDEIEELDAEHASIVALARVPHESPVFDGHFPGHALMPGVLLLETMAQAAGYLLLAMNDFTRMPFFASAKEVNFRSFVLPGTALKATAKCIHNGSGYAVIKARLERDGACVSDAQLTMRNVMFPSLALERHVRNEGERLGFLKAAVR